LILSENIYVMTGVFDTKLLLQTNVSAMSSTKKGIVLMNLGSPESTSVGDVRTYLNEFLMDERVIDMNYIARLLLVRGIIVPFRAPKSAAAYRSIWTKEGSPLIVLSKQLQQALQQQVEEPVVLAMRYGNPTPGAAFDELMQKVPGLEEVVLVPLYPHYAMSSYETAAEYAKEIYRKKKYPFKLTIVPVFYNEPAYLHALAESIKPCLQQEYDHIVFSYHGIPERHVHKTDPTHQHCLKSTDCCFVKSEAHKYCYRHQVIVTTNETAKLCSIPAGKFSYSFQSRLGRDEWLKPYTVEQLKLFPGQGIKKLIIVCPAFVSDCLETLEEIAEEGKEIFLQSGGESFTLIPCLNVHPLWIKALAGLIKNVPVAQAG
jgi:protoporphyrin/coproporphyrin ferrochelatase